MLAFFVFYKGYYAICKGPSHGTSLLLFYISSGIMILLWFVFTIIKSASFNGFTKLSVLKNCNLIFPLVLSVFEIIMYYFSIGLSIFCLIKISKTYGKGEPFRAQGYEMSSVP